LWEWGWQVGFEIFYDDYSMEKREYSEDELETILSSAICKGDIMTAFVSNEDTNSCWCRFE